MRLVTGGTGRGYALGRGPAARHGRSAHQVEARFFYRLNGLLLSSARAQL